MILVWPISISERLFKSLGEKIQIRKKNPYLFLQILVFSVVDLFATDFLLAAIVTRFQVRCRERLGHHTTPGGLAGRGDEGALQHPALPRGAPALHLPEAIDQLHSTHQIDISKNVKSVQIFNKIWRNIIFKMHISKLVKTG